MTSPRPSSDPRTRRMIGLPLRVRIAAEPSSTVTRKSFMSAGITTRRVSAAPLVFTSTLSALPLNSPEIASSTRTPPDHP